MIHPNDKAGWCRAGERMEREFVRDMAEAGMHFKINPEKEHNPYAVDLLMLLGDAWVPADLKRRETRFRKAGALYGIPTTTAVTLNVADCKRYAKEEPRVWLVFDVDYPVEVVDGAEYPAVRMIRFASLDDVRSLVRSGIAKLHRYKTRDGTDGNKTESYVFDVLWLREHGDLP